MVYLLENSTQPYAWGSPTAIPELFGIQNPTGEPMAEIWMGAHSKAPSRLITGNDSISLEDYIEEDPEGVLGKTVADRFGGRLPFLFKVLAAAGPLSIQAHPSLAQAQSGFARENEAGIPPGAPERNYRDDNHKPELIYALTPFWGMRGFRPPAEIRADFNAWQESRHGGLVLPQDDAGLKPFFRSLMQLPDDEQESLLGYAARLALENWPLPTSQPEPGDQAARFYWLHRLAEKYPGDVGAVAPLFLNLFQLNPGEATYQPAGVLHAYLEGTGFELMANSDNVLRGGLTPKHIDLDELLAVGVYRTEESRIMAGIRRAADTETNHCSTIDFPAPFDEFAFSRTELRGRCTIPGGMPRIIFCLSGHLELSAAPMTVTLGVGESAFATASEEQLNVTGSGAFVCATVGRLA